MTPTQRRVRSWRREGGGPKREAVTRPEVAPRAPRCVWAGCQADAEGVTRTVCREHFRAVPRWLQTALRNHARGVELRDAGRLSWQDEAEVNRRGGKLRRFVATVSRKIRLGMQ